MQQLMKLSTCPFPGLPILACIMKQVLALGRLICTCYYDIAMQQRPALIMDVHSARPVTQVVAHGRCELLTHLLRMGLPLAFPCWESGASFNLAGSVPMSIARRRGAVKILTSALLSLTAVPSMVGRSHSGEGVARQI
ncbi:hypothetical protein F5B21DRAFT_145585 [Xylaria acuta]|nr:hypothetical protein F5B21DRAFT_145585 [Xylaria acuta]